MDILTALPSLGHHDVRKILIMFIHCKYAFTNKNPRCIIFGTLPQRLSHTILRTPPVPLITCSKIANLRIIGV